MAFSMTYMLSEHFLLLWRFFTVTNPKKSDSIGCRVTESPAAEATIGMSFVTRAI